MIACLYLNGEVEFMRDMRNNLKDVQNMLEQHKDNKLMKQQLIIAEIRYMVQQNIVLAYKQYNSKNVTIQGIVRDIRIQDSSIIITIGCIVYGYTDAVINCRLSMQEENISDVSQLITGSLAIVQGLQVVENNDIIVIDSKILNCAQQLENLKTLNAM